MQFPRVLIDSRFKSLPRALRNLQQGFRQPVYPALLAAYVPVWMLSNNLGLFTPRDAIRPVILAILLTLAVFGALLCLYRDRHKAGFVAAACIGAFFCFGYVRSLVPIASAGTGTLVILATICLIAAFVAFKIPRFSPRVTIILNVFIGFMLVFPVFELVRPSLAPPTTPTAAATQLPVTQMGNRPNIVHIVLDAYSSADVLQELYGFDNSPFVESLRKKGFAVSDRATAAYNQTILSMNSVFALNYINDRVKHLMKKNTEKEVRILLNRDMQNSLLLQTLRSHGYELINVEGLYRGVHLKNVDHVVSEDADRFRISYFENELLQLTPIHRLMAKFAAEAATVTQIRFALGPQDYSPYKSPFFVYNHIIAPHSPFNISANGEPRATSFAGLGDDNHRLDRKPGWYEEYRSGYVEKLRYVNSKLLEKIEHLLSNVPDPKIIILHSDHGGGLLNDKRERTRTCQKERMSTFLAVYASDANLAKAFPDRINLVNLYRILFSTLFGADLPPLPAHSYFVAAGHMGTFEEVPQSELETFGLQCSEDRYANETQ